MAYLSPFMGPVIPIESLRNPYKSNSTSNSASMKELEEKLFEIMDKKFKDIESTLSSKGTSEPIDYDKIKTQIKQEIKGETAQLLKNYVTIDTYNKDINSLEAVIKRNFDTLSAPLRAQIEAQNKSLATITANNTTLMNESRANTDRINAIENSSAQMNTAIASVMKEVNDRQSEINKINEEFNKKIAQLNTSSNSTNNTEIQAQIQALTTTHTTELKNLRDSLTQQKTDTIAELTKLLNTEIGKLQSNNVNNTVIDNLKAEFHTKMAELSRTIANTNETLETTMNTQSQLNNTYRISIERLNINLRRIEDEMKGQLDTIMKDVNERLSSQTKSQIEKEKGIDEKARTRQAALNEELLNTNNDKLRAEILNEINKLKPLYNNELSQFRTDMMKTLKAEKQAVIKILNDNADAKIKALHAKIDSIKIPEDKSASLKQQIDDINTTFQNYKTQIEQKYDGKIKEIRGNINRLNPQIGLLEERINKLDDYNRHRREGEYVELGANRDAPNMNVFPKNTKGEYMTLGANEEPGANKELGANNEPTYVEIGQPPNPAKPLRTSSIPPSVLPGHNIGTNKYLKGGSNKHSKRFLSESSEDLELNNTLSDTSIN